MCVKGVCEGSYSFFRFPGGGLNASACRLTVKMTPGFLLSKLQQLLSRSGWLEGGGLWVGMSVRRWGELCRVA